MIVNSLERIDKWKTRQARVLLDSLCVDLWPEERFEGGDVGLLLEDNRCVIHCEKCGEAWEVDSIVLNNGLVRIQAFIPWGLGYRDFYRCPNECNKTYNWDEGSQRSRVLDDIN